MFGSKAPNLQRLAMKILNLTCSASGCERNWSVFEQLHSVKRNALDQKKLNDLVFIKYNYKLKERYSLLSRAIASKKKFDPLELNDNEAGTADEWLVGGTYDVGDEEVFPGEGLTWRVVEEAAGLDLPLRATRSSTQNVNISSSSRAPATIVYSRGPRGRGGVGFESGHGVRGNKGSARRAMQKQKSTPSISSSRLIDDIYNEPDFEEEDDDDDEEEVDELVASDEDDDFSGESGE